MKTEVEDTAHIDNVTQEVNDTGTTIEVRKFLLSQYRIEYNMDRIVRLERRAIVAAEHPAVRLGQRQWNLEGVELVQNARAVAAQEHRQIIPWSDILEEYVVGNRS